MLMIIIIIILKCLKQLILQRWGGCVFILCHKCVLRFYCACLTLQTCSFASTLLLECLFLTDVHLFWHQKTNDNQEQVMKKKKKKELGNLEKKPPKKNRVPKQGWVLSFTLIFILLVDVVEGYVRVMWPSGWNVLSQIKTTVIWCEVWGVGSIQAVLWRGRCFSAERWSDPHPHPNP